MAEVALAVAGVRRVYLLPDGQLDPSRANHETLPRRRDCAPGLGGCRRGFGAVPDAKEHHRRAQSLAAVTGGGVPRLLCRGMFRERDTRASCRHHRSLGPLPAVLYGDLRRSHLCGVCRGRADCLRELGCPPPRFCPWPGGCQPDAGRVALTLQMTPAQFGGRLTHSKCSERQKGQTACR